MPHASPEISQRSPRAPPRGPKLGQVDDSFLWARKYILDVLDITAGLIFVVGSACFLPCFVVHLEVFIEGCFLFVVGCVIYTGISGFCLWEAVTMKGLSASESTEQLMYLIGSVAFLVGTVLYWPNHSEILFMSWAKKHSLGAYFHLFSAEYEGTLLFILGSIFFAAAAFVHGHRHQRNKSLHARIHGAMTVTYIAGSLFLVVGSIAFLPEVSPKGSEELVVTIGAICYIVGSTLYVVGGVLSMAITWLFTHDPEKEPLVADL